MIRKAKAKIKSGKLGVAQQCLEDAFLLDEGNKDTFLLYAGVLKALKQPRALQILITRWKGANERKLKLTQEN